MLTAKLPDAAVVLLYSHPPRWPNPLSNCHYLPAGSSTGIGMGILKQLAAGGATTVMHGLVSEEELQQKAAAVQQQYGTTVGISRANLMQPQEIRWAALYGRVGGLANA